MTDGVLGAILCAKVDVALDLEDGGARTEKRLNYVEARTAI